MASPWIEHVLEFQKKYNISFKDALKQAGKTYKKDKPSGNKERKTHKKKKHRKKKRSCRSR